MHDDIWKMEHIKKREKFKMVVDGPVLLEDQRSGYRGLVQGLQNDWIAGFSCKV